MKSYLNKRKVRFSNYFSEKYCSSKQYEKTVFLLRIKPFDANN